MPIRKLSFVRDMGEIGRNPKRPRVAEQVATASFRVLNDITELGVAVTRDLITPDVYETANNLYNLKQASGFNYNVVMKDPHLKRIDSGFREAIAIASDLSASLVAHEAKNIDPDDIAAHGKLLSLLSPARRSDIVRCALEVKDEDDQAIAIAGLWEGADHLRSAERSLLAKQSIALASLPNNTPAKAIAVAGLWQGGIKHLTTNERAQLVTATIDLDPQKRAEAISGAHWQWGHRTLRNGQIGESLQYLQAEDRSALVKSFGEMSADSRAIAIGAMSAGLNCLKPEEVKNLVEMVTKPEHPHALGKVAPWAIRNMGPGLKFLDEHQINELAEVVSDGRHAHHSSDPGLNADAMAALAPKLRNFNAYELYEVLSNTDHPDYLSAPADVSYTLGDWGDKLDVFRPGQRTEFVKIITDRDHPRALTDERDKSNAISGMGHGLGHLKLEDRSSIVRAALDLTQSELKAEAIAGLGQGLEHLQQSDRSSLVEAIRGLDDVDGAVVIAGLSKGLAFLHPNERRELAERSKELPETLIGYANEELSIRSLAITRLMAGVNAWQTEVRENKNVVVIKRESVMDRGLSERSRDRGLSPVR